MISIHAFTWDELWEMLRLFKYGSYPLGPYSEKYSYPARVYHKRSAWLFDCMTCVCVCIYSHNAITAYSAR